LQYRSSEQQTNLFRVSREALLALFLLFNYFVYLVIRPVLGAELGRVFDSGALVLLDLIFILLVLLLLVKNVIALKRAGTLIGLVFFRIVLLAIIAAEFVFLFAQSDFFHVIDHPIFIWMIFVVSFEWFLFKTLLCEEQSFLLLKNRYSIPSWTEYRLIPWLFFLLVATTFGFAYHAEIAEGRIMAIFIPVTVLSQFLSYLIVLRFSLLPVVRFLEQHQTQVSGQSFWRILSKLRRSLFLLETLDLPGQVRLQSVKVLDGRAEVSAVNALLLRFAEHFKGEFCSALHDVLSSAPVKRLPDFSSIEIIPGRGGRAVCEGQQILLGGEEFLVANGVALQHSELGAPQAGYFYLYLTAGQHVLARLRLAERLIADGDEYFAKLRPLAGVSEVCVAFEDAEFEEAISQVKGVTRRSEKSASQLRAKFASERGETLLFLQEPLKDGASIPDNFAVLHMYDSQSRISNLVGAGMQMVRSDLGLLADVFICYRRAQQIRRWGLPLGLLLSVGMLYLVYWPVPAEVSPFFWLGLLALCTICGSWFAWYQSKLSIKRD
jgi:hypothetical protein